MDASLLESAIRAVREGAQGAAENLTAVLKDMLKSGDMLYAPADIDLGQDAKSVNVGDKIANDKIKASLKIVKSGGESYFVLFTSEDEMKKGPKVSSLTVPLYAVASAAVKNEAVRGVIINPFSTPINIPKEVLEKLIANE